jgi:hypothetical protein
MQIAKCKLQIEESGTRCVRASCLLRNLQWAICILQFAIPFSHAQSLLPGEFADIDLGRTLLAPSRFPTIKELREAVREPNIRSVAMLKLHADGNNHYLPVWSHDGLRLAFQRSNLKERASKILLYPALSQAKASVLDETNPAYDYMFRWAQSSPAGYAFTRIDAESGSARLWVSDGNPPTLKTKTSGRHTMPALYERTDGIWRLAYEKDGKLMLEAWRGDEVIDEPLDLGRGTSPRWSAGGGALLLARARSGKVGAFDIAVLVLPDKETQLSTSEVVRSPAWSPDELFAAYFAKDAGDNKPWRIEIASLAAQTKPRVLVQDVVVNPNFDSDEPTWEPSSRRVWCFSHRQRKQAYYPLVAVDLESGRETVVDYPQRCTNPGDLAMNPKTFIPELAFVAHDGLPQDLYVLFLNHY